MKIGLTCLALAMVTPVAAHATTVDFDDLAAGSLVGGAYSAFGVTFNHAEVVTFGHLPGGTPANAIAHDDLSTTFGPESAISVVFDFVVSSVSLTGLDVGAAGFLFRGFDATVGGNLVDAKTAFGDGLGIGEFFTLDLAGSIRRIEFSQVLPNYSDGIAFDNLSFETGDIAPVPLPAALPLSLAGLGMLAAVRRRRRA
jgi:hypothetical protein